MRDLDHARTPPARNSLERFEEVHEHDRYAVIIARPERSSLMVVVDAVPWPAEQRAASPY
jgi:hypothetical protein